MVVFINKDLDDKNIIWNYIKTISIIMALCHQISRSHGLKNQQFEFNLSKITRPVAAIKSLGFAFYFSCDQAALWMIKSVRLSVCLFHLIYIFIHPATKLVRGVYWIHPVCLSVSVCLSVCPSVNLSCPPCGIYSSRWILSIFGTNDQ